MHLAIAAGLIAGLALGLLASATGAPALHAFAEGVRPLGVLFMNAIRMVVVPLVVAAVFLGVARLGDPRRLGRLGGLALGFFAATTVAAIAIGMGAASLATGLGPALPDAPLAESEPPRLPDLVDALLGLVPENPVRAAAEGALLPLIVFTILVAAAAGSLEEPRRRPLVALAESTCDVLTRLAHWILWTAPVGVFALAAPATAEAGWAVLRSLAVFVAAVIAGLALFVAGVYAPALRFLSRLEPAVFARACLAPAAIGFGATSSVPALPALFEAAAGLRISPAAAGLVLPLGASLNRAGSALFQGAAIVFLAALYRVELSWTGIATAAVATFLVAHTVAPVPSAGVVTLAPALGAVGVPLAGLGLLLGVDRVPDTFRSATNVIGHLVCAGVVDARVGRLEEPG